MARSHIAPPSAAETAVAFADIPEELFRGMSAINTAVSATVWRRMWGPKNLLFFGNPHAPPPRGRNRGIFRGHPAE